MSKTTAEKLREALPADLTRLGQDVNAVWLSMLLNQAADEIEHLWTELEYLQMIREANS